MDNCNDYKHVIEKAFLNECDFTGGFIIDSEKHSCGNFTKEESCKDTIVCLVGASGTGKTTIAKELEKEGYNIIQSYTTRKKREQSEWGHIFITDWYPIEINGTFVGVENREMPTLGMTNKHRCIDIDHMIAYFNDYNKNEHYFATIDQYKNKGTSIYIVDPDGTEQVKRSVKDAEVITVFLTADKGVRFDRIFERTYSLGFAEASVDEANNRVGKDSEIFKVCKCDYTVDANREVKEVLKNVIEIIEND